MEPLSNFGGIVHQFFIALDLSLDGTKRTQLTNRQDSKRRMSGDHFVTLP